MTMRNGKVTVVVAVLFLAAAFFVMYRPTLRPGPEISPHPLIISSKLEGVRLHVFSTGDNKMSWFLVGDNRPWRPVPAFVIEHPQKGLFVFDTGLPDAVAKLGEAGLPIPERWVIESRSVESLMLPAQMREAGLDPLEVHQVFISHLHGDHVGQIQAFPNAEFIGGHDSAAFAQSASVQQSWKEQSFEAGTSFGPFDASVDLAGDKSIVLIGGGGHSSEGLMLFLALEEGPVLLAGDAVVHADWLRSEDVQRIVVDANRAAVVRNQVRAFLDTTPGSSVAYGHDLRGIDCERHDIVCHRSENFYPDSGARFLPAPATQDFENSPSGE